MKTMTSSKNMNKQIINNVLRLMLSFLVAFALTLTTPIGLQKAFAAPLEDCDLDGFDDATGVPVPWPGYDETKGDTPEGPGGSAAPTTAPSSSNNNTTGTTGGGTSGSTSGSTNNTNDNTSNTTSGNTTSGNTNSNTSSGSTNTSQSSNNNSSNTSSNTNTSTSGSKNNTTSESKNTTKSGSTNTAGSTNTSNNTNSSTSESKNTSTSGSTNNTTTTSTGSTSNAAESNTNTSTSNSSSSTTNNTVSNDNSTSNTTTNNGDTVTTDNGEVVTTDANEVAGDITESTDPSTTDGQAEAPQNENDQVTVGSETEANENNSVVAEDISSIINTKGALLITETTGSLIHVGSSVIVTGTGFIGNLDNLEIEIHSDGRQLGNVTSLEDGSFEAQVYIPEDLEAGTHNIVVLYQGQEITRQLIEVGPKAADSFIDALTVGFTKDNKGLVPGLVILAGLLGLGALVFVGSAVVRKGKK